MADKGSKKKPKSKHAKQTAEPSVLGSLSSTRPTGLARRREAGGGASAEETPANAAASASAATATAAPASAKPRRSERPTPARRPRTSTGTRTRATATAARTRKPTAVRPGAPSLDGPPRVAEQAPPPRHVGPPRGTELVTTAIQAAGEIAQIGLTVGGQVLKRAVDRLPKR